MPRLRIRGALALLAVAAHAAQLPGPAPGFEPVLAPRALHFPADHGPHPAFRQEWWYFTGHLAANSGERFGFELTFFRFALAPPGAAPAGPSSWRARELYLAHFAVSDLGARRFRYRRKLARGALGLAGATGEPLAVWIDDWRLRAAPGEEGVHWHVSASEPGYALDLELSTDAAPVLQGEAGFSRKGAEPGAASYYYSLPRLAARGTVRRGGAALAVQGLVWCDREWGSGGLGAGQAGWDWFGLQLSDGSALMFYALRTRAGTRAPFSAGSFVAPSGHAQPLDSAQVRIESQGRWRSAEGTVYPSGWHLSVPSLALDLRLTPELTDQELVTTPRYWEGAVAVRGQRGGTSLGGAGYVELTGYAPERPPGTGSSLGPRLAR